MTASLVLIQWMKRLSSRSKCKGCLIMVGLHWKNGTLVTPRCSPIFQMSSRNFISYMLFLKPPSILRPSGIEWSTVSDHFRLMISELPCTAYNNITKWVLIFDVSKTIDVFWWFSLCTVYHPNEDSLSKIVATQGWLGWCCQSLWEDHGCTGDPSSMFRQVFMSLVATCTIQ